MTDARCHVEQVRSTLDLDAVCDFLNTVDVEGGTDALSDPSGLARWVVGAGLATHPPTVDDGELRTARRLRAVLRDLARSHQDAIEAPEAAAELTRFAADLEVGLAFAPEGRVVFSSRGAGVAGALGQVVAAVAAGSVDGSWRRTKLCSADDCAWAFHDASRNRSGRWCSMAVCGNRAKSRSFRARHET